LRAKSTFKASVLGESSDEASDKALEDIYDQVDHEDEPESNNPETVDLQNKQKMHEVKKSKTVPKLQ
jgi:hypothetical protein